MELHMKEAVDKYKDNVRIAYALKCGVKKLDPYMKRETSSKYHLLGVGMYCEL